MGRRTKTPAALATLTALKTGEGLTTSSTSDASARTIALLRTRYSSREIREKVGGEQKLQHRVSSQEQAGLLVPVVG
mgnify:CR=1 FL=1